MKLPKLPTIVRGDVRIPGVKKNIPKAAIILIFAVALGTYYFSKRGAVKEGAPPPLMADPNQTLVDYEVIPPEVRPDSFITVVGRFTDLQGSPVTVPSAQWYAWETDISTQGKEIKGQGSVGLNVSTFSIDIPTAGFRQGQYSVTVTDAPLPPNESILMGRGPITTGGSGEVARGPDAATTPGSVTFAIS